MFYIEERKNETYSSLLQRFPTDPKRNFKMDVNIWTFVGKF